ncbi:MAG: hypothetical protein ABSH33_21080 [Steroidobacteraceae bacterium]|jgi:hypothetical protein
MNTKAAVRAILCAAALGLLGANAFAVNPDADQATRMYNRIAGIPPSAAVLAQMMNTDSVSAALLATNDPAFYNNTIRNLAAPWTNRDQSVFVPLNDYTATVVGMVRDNVPFNTLLSADLVYIASAGAASTFGLPAYSPANNDLYQAMDDSNVDLKANLVPSTQSAITGIPAAATAGVMTTRGAASAFFVNGTNRAMFRFTMMNHLCDDLPTVMDTTRPPDRIRQDVTRSPGGVSTLFLTNCIGCHSGMDPMAQAFAYYNFSYPASEIGATAWPIGQIVYTANQVQPKYFINNTNFPQGYVTPNDGWTNRWRSGPNEILGWSAALPGSGSGAKSLGQELAGSAAFATCQVTRVFKDVCLRAPSSNADAAQVTSMIQAFQASNYSLRQVFAEGAAYCMGN